MFSLSIDPERLRRLPWRPVPFALALAAAAGILRAPDVDAAAPNPSFALRDALAIRGLAAHAEDVLWWRAAGGLQRAATSEGRALVRASMHGEPNDLYLVATRLSPEGVLLAVGETWNVTRTSGVDETAPLLRGSLAAYATVVDGIATGVHALNLDGQSPFELVDFNPLQRWQTSLTNLEQTGQMSGVEHDAFGLDPVANTIALNFREDGLLDVTADDRRILLDLERGVPVLGAGWVRVTPEGHARPGNLVTWAVDRVRSMAWFGDESLQWLKAVTFTAFDWALRVRSSVMSDNTAREVAEDLGGVNGGKTAVTFTDPEIGWPPTPMTPLMSPAVPGEGKWIALDRDPFITQTPGTPPAFVTSFVRADRERPGTRIYVTLWDPRQISLHMEAGTVEPVSATGEAGTGVIPRTPEVVRRVVAGFNGGFQAMHGEFGMQANGVLYLPPKPYAATVFELRDGTTAMGSWPNSSVVPEQVLSYRQNLTALIENGRFNPWGRTWWGGTPPGWSDNIHTTRSGICITQEKFVGYFWGVNISAEVLANGMQAARCSYGVHLDMNPGLAGFEFYNIQTTSNWTEMGRPLQGDWEAEGTFRDFPEFRYRARRMVRGMANMNFPQFIHRDGRDFFYLTQRPVLPGPAIGQTHQNATAGGGTWRVKGLPQHGFPYSLATTEITPDPSRPDAKATVLRIDPRTLQIAGGQGTTDTTPTIVSFQNATHDVGRAMGLWFTEGVFSISPSLPAKGAVLIAVGQPSTPPPNASPTRVAIGIHDEDGMLNWVEWNPGVVPDASSAKALDALLETIGCTSRIHLTNMAHVSIGGTLDIFGAASSPSTGPLMRLVRGHAPGAQLYFEDTAIVPPSVWQPLQARRVRYFRKTPPR